MTPATTTATTPEATKAEAPPAPPAPTKCPRCNGPMLAESDAHGIFGTCLACGHVHETRVITSAELAEEQQVEEGRQRRRQPSHGKLRL